MGVYLIFGVALLLLLVVSLYAARMVWRVIWKTSQAVPPLEAEIAECRRTVQHDLTPSVDAARRELGQLRESAVRMNAQLEADLKAHWDTQLKAELDAHKSALSHQLADIRASLPPAKPAYEDPIPFLDGMSEQDVLRIAKELAFVRPLAPYPNWFFDADWQNPDLAFRMRRSILTYFRSRKTTAALEIPWHCGLQLQIYFGNDLSGQLYVGGCIDPNEFALLDKLLTPGMVFLDIGANEGIYSVFASHRVGNAGSVWAFEPSGREMDRLNANVRLNSLTNVRTFSLALADEDTDAEFAIAGDEHAGHNTLGQFVFTHTKLSRRESVPLRRLDSLLQENSLQRLDFLKIDVEGAEMRVLAGARGALSRFRPWILLEVNDPPLKAQGSSRESLIQFLQALDYRLYLFDNATGLPVSADAGCYGENMLAAPIERNMPESALLPLPAIPS